METIINKALKYRDAKSRIDKAKKEIEEEEDSEVDEAIKSDVKSDIKGSVASHPTSN